ncbi:MAG: hypothetical protein R8G66_24590 [Cytophagales bacterium]|nr:hypothetical protein [Cytophagales bacterium]
METLKKLTPAETLVLRDTSQASFRDLLKFTLIDLILKKVLVVRNESNPEPEEENKVAYKNLEKGPAYDSYQPKAHEWIYLAPYEKDADLSIQFRHLVKMGWESARSRNNYLFKQVLMSKDIARAAKEGWFYRTFGYCNLTPEGQLLQQRVNAELGKLADILPNLIENNPEGAKELMGHIYGNIMLVPSFDYSLLKQLDEVFEEELIERNTDMHTDTAAIWFFFLYDDFHSSFDSEYDSYGGDSGWGGGGCSGGDGGGCSGCGGCGGCGG